MRDDDEILRRPAVSSKRNNSANKSAENGYDPLQNDGIHKNGSLPRSSSGISSGESARSSLSIGRDSGDNGIREIKRNKNGNTVKKSAENDESVYIVHRGRKIVKKKKRQCIKCKLITRCY